MHFWIFTYEFGLSMLHHLFTSYSMDSVSRKLATADGYVQYALVVYWNPKKKSHTWS